MNVKFNNDRLQVNHNYYKELSKFDNLTTPEINDLYVLIKTGDTKAFNVLVQSNLKLVVHFAKQYKRIIQNSDIVELDDLISEGNIGLIESINRFKPELNIKFSYYASFWIKKLIQEYLYNNLYTIRIPASKIQSDNKIRKEIDVLFQKEQRTITQNDIDNLEIFTDTESKHFFNKTTVKKFDDLYQNNFDNTMNFEPLDIIIDSVDETDTTNEIEAIELKRKITLGLKHLKPKQRQILKLYFGIDSENDKKLNLREIGDIYNLTKMRILQIIRESLIILKPILEP